MIEVYVESIRVNMTNYKRVVMLKEKTGQRFLPIWIGHFEADAIAIPMQNVPVSRPLTHDLLMATIGQLGARCTQTAITRLENETFYATLVVDQDGRHVEIDCRPSDAISAAIRARVPIFVDDAVMDRASMTFDEVAERDRSRAAPAGSPAEPSSYWPGAEPPGGAPPEPFGQLGSVTEPVQAALAWAVDAAERGRRRWIGPGDLLLGLLRQPRAASNRVLGDLNVELEELQNAVEQEIRRDQPALILTSAAEAVIRRAVEEAARLDESIVGAEHLLLALAGESEGSVPAALDKLGVSLDAIRRQVAVLLAQAATPDEPPADEPPA